MDTAPPDFRHESVLIIDDHGPLRARVKDLLCAEFPGLEVREATSGEEAFSTVARDRPGLVLLDLRLPGMDGFSVLTGLRDRRPDLPVIVLSALPTIPYASVVSRMGAVGYVSKSSLPGDLVRVIRLALSVGKEMPRSSNDNGAHAGA